MQQLTMFDREVFGLFVNTDAGEIVEVRALNAWGTMAGVWEDFARGTVVGYFDNFDDFNKSVEPLIKIEKIQIYMSLQVINPDLLGRAFNRLKAANSTVSDADVLFYRWLLVDIDPVRPSGVSSSDEELSMAMQKRDEISEFCVEKYGMSPPVTCMSGNGSHALFPLANLPAQDEKVQETIKNTLINLDHKFSNEYVKVDTSVFNPGRITKFYGSKACKGDPVPGGKNRIRRPHRWSYIDSLGEAK